MSQPALPVARVRSRASLKAAVIGGVLVALGAVGFVVLRSSDHAKPKPAVVLTEPKAGLAAIDRYAHQRGEGEELGSEPMWESALDDFTHANAQPNAPVRWTAGEHFARGMLALIRGEVAGAATEFRAASTADPTWAVPQGALAEVLHRQDRFDDALVAARAAQQLEPSEWTWVVTGAHVYRAWNRLDDAIREYRRALTMAPKEPLLLSELALVVHAAHLDSEADRLAHDALALDPNLAGPHIIFAERALEAHDGKTALDEATRVASLLPGSVSALLSIGDAEVLLGDATAARDAYKRAIAAWNTHKNKGASESRIAMAERDIADGVIEKRIEVERDAARSRAEVANAKTDAARKAVLAKQKAADAAKPADDMRSRAPADRKPCVCQDGDPLCSCL